MLNTEAMRTVINMVLAYRKDQLRAVIVIKVSVMMVLINVDAVLIHSSVTQMSVNNDDNGYLNKMTTNAVSFQISCLQGYSRKRLREIPKELCISKKMVNSSGLDGTL